MALQHTRTPGQVTLARCLERRVIRRAGSTVSAAMGGYSSATETRVVVVVHTCTLVWHRGVAWHQAWSEGACVAATVYRMDAEANHKVTRLFVGNDGNEYSIFKIFLSFGFRP